MKCYSFGTVPGVGDTTSDTEDTASAQKIATPGVFRASDASPGVCSHPGNNPPRCVGGAEGYHPSVLFPTRYPKSKDPVNGYNNFWGIFGIPPGEVNGTTSSDEEKFGKTFGLEYLQDTADLLYNYICLQTRGRWTEFGCSGFSLEVLVLVWMSSWGAKRFF